MSPTSAVVTGAASGLGLAVVQALTADGARVVGVDLPGDERAAVVADCGRDVPRLRRDQLRRLGGGRRGIEARLGQVDLLALNAGVMTRSPRDPLDDDPLELAGSAGYRRVFAVNVDGVVLGLAALRPLLAPGASVVVTASQAGLTPLPFDPFYAMTKHAVVGFVRSMAPPLAAADIRINALCPGGIDTAIVPDPLRATVPAEAFRPPALIARSLLAVAAAADDRGHVAAGRRRDGPALHRSPVALTRLGRCCVQTAAKHRALCLRCSSLRLLETLVFGVEVRASWGCRRWTSRRSYLEGTDPVIPTGGRWPRSPPASSS